MLPSSAPPSLYHVGKRVSEPAPASTITTLQIVSEDTSVLDGGHNDSFLSVWESAVSHRIIWALLFQNIC